MVTLTATAGDLKHIALEQRTAEIKLNDDAVAPMTVSSASFAVEVDHAEQMNTATG
jgi:hypothetical protein